MFSISPPFTNTTRKTSPITRAAVAAIQNMALPPPAYTTNPDPPRDLAYLDPESDSETDVSEWNEPPVTIHINASITIEGNSNQVALPTHPSARSLQVIGDNLRAVQGSPQDYTGYPSPVADRLACDRAEQISDAVMQALKDSGVLAGTVTPMRRLDVCVDASVTVKGEKNVLTTIVPLRRNVSTVRTPPETPTSSVPLCAVDRTGAERGSESSTVSPRVASTSRPSTEECDATKDLAQGSGVVHADSKPQDSRRTSECPLMPRSPVMENADGSGPVLTRLGAKRRQGEQDGMRTVKRKRTVT